MLKDTVRTDNYRDFIYDNKHLFDGKVVLDVGCGTGILSMFAAKMGAKVYGVDNSNIIDKARINIKDNGFEDKITLIKGKMETVELPEKVDIIVSEWMGYCLLYEAMLPSVLVARDRWLKPGGLMVPSHCVIHLAPFSSQDFVDEHVNFWRDVYGFDMRAMVENAYDDVIGNCPPLSSTKAPGFPFFTLDLHTIKIDELVFKKEYEFKLTSDASNLDGFVVWFDTFFIPDRNYTLPENARAETWKGPGNAFTTGPGGKETHWKSGVMLIDRKRHAITPLPTGSRISGYIAYDIPKTAKRSLEIQMSWQVDQGDNGQQTWHVQ
jgi:protein arginine N-methyltransferase 3